MNGICYFQGVLTLLVQSLGIFLYFFRLLIHFSDLPPPGSGWDRLPNSSDFSLSADVARLKYYRNIIAHFNLAYVGNELNDGEFKSLWEEIKNALLRIVSHYAPSSVEAWEEAIDELRVAPLADGHEFRKKKQIISGEVDRQALQRGKLISLTAN